MIQFVCVDCKAVKAVVEGECQVIFGTEACPRCQRHDVPVGRCLPCGKGLPAIDGQQPYRFRWNERPFRISLVWSPAWHVWLYLLEQQIGQRWQNVKVMRTYDLRDAIGKLHLDPLTVDDVLDAHLAVRQLPDEDFVAAFKALAKR